MESKLIQDIVELNERYLVLAREIARTDLELARVQLGISATVAHRLQDLTMQQIKTAVQIPGVLLFKLRGGNDFWSRFLDAAAAQDRSSIEVAGVLVATLAAGECDDCPGG